MRAALLANLLYAEAVGRKGIHYSRDRSAYSDLDYKHYAPHWATNRAMLVAVASLLADGLVIETRARPGSATARRSALAAAVPLTDLLRDVGQLRFLQARRIHLKDQDHRRTTYQTSPEIEAMEADVIEHEVFLNSFTILPGERAQIDRFGIMRGVETPSLAIRQHYRVFNRDFSQGGRIYGGWWQMIPGDERAAITINGRATVEQDYSCCHPRLLAALSGQSGNATVDFYDIPGDFCRSDVKIAVNALLNADTYWAAVLGVADELRKRGMPSAYSLACRLCEAIAAACPDTARYFGTGIGRHLQKVDAGICVEVQSRLRRRNIPVLSVHDGFVVPAEHGRALSDVMVEEFDRACHRLRQSR